MMTSWFSMNTFGCPASDGVPAITDWPFEPWQPPQTARRSLPGCANAAPLHSAASTQPAAPRMPVSVRS